MRPLEIGILLGLLAGLAVLLLPRRGSGMLPALLAGGLLALAAAHLLAEGARWQMVPAYALTPLLAGLLLWRLRPGRAGAARRWWRTLGLGLLGLLLWLVAAALPALVPVPRLPSPDGPYQVGTSSYQFVDLAREEAYTATPGDAREIMVQLWYPAAPAPGAPTGEWMSRIDVAGPAIARYLKLPAFVLNHAALVRTNAYPDAPLVGGAARLPVVIYSHGWNGFRAINTNQMEALASHGFIAIGIDHTYGALATVLADGRVLPNNPAALPDGAPDEVYQRASEVLEATFAADVEFVIDQLAQLDRGAIDPQFAGRVDRERVGLFGHSTGGGAIALVCSRDPRCKAGLGMDAWLVPVPRAIIPGPLRQPFLFMRSEVWASAKNDARLDEIYGQLAGPGYRLTILGTKHYDFTLLPLLSPLAPALGLKGPLDGERTLALVRDYLVAFFDTHLRGQLSPLLAGPAPSYPEVRFERKE